MTLIYELDLDIPAAYQKWTFCVKAFKS